MTLEKKICDKCGELIYKDGGLYMGGTVNVLRIFAREISYDSETINVDLCPACTEVLLGYLKKEH